jgi:hypothetical protein
MNPAPIRSATGVARVNPRASIPATLVTPVLEGLGHLVDQALEGLSVTENGCDVLEHHSLLREVGNVANQCLEKSSTKVYGPETASLQTNTAKWTYPGLEMDREMGGSDAAGARTSGFFVTYPAAYRPLGDPDLSLFDLDNHAVVVTETTVP